MRQKNHWPTKSSLIQGQGGTPPSLLWPSMIQSEWAKTRRCSQSCSVHWLAFVCLVQRDSAVAIMAACAGKARHPRRGGSGRVSGFHLHHCNLLLSGAKERTCTNVPSRSELPQHTPVTYNLLTGLVKNVHLILNECQSVFMNHVVTLNVLDSSEEPWDPNSPCRLPLCRTHLWEQVNTLTERNENNSS